MNEHDYTPENITGLKDNEVFVYGTNQFAKHLGGAALAALKFGAQMENVPIGLCGNTYGIITTSFNDVKVKTDFIMTQLQVLYRFAEFRPDLTFYVTKIGTGIGGFSIEDIADVFFSLELWRPSNIILPIEFSLKQSK